MPGDTRDTRNFCLTGTGLKTFAELREAAVRTRARLHETDAVCNLIQTRFDFAALLLAARDAGVRTLLPSSRASGAIAYATEGSTAPLVIERLSDLPPPAPLPTKEKIQHGTVTVFTSGSTGTPFLHEKTWAHLTGGAGAAISLLSGAGLTPESCLIVGTTPHQHMYGLEAALFAGLAGGYCVLDRPVFYPADLEAACADAAAHGFTSIALITSPPHLTYFADAIEACPSVHGIISATAPLSVDLAQRIEERTGAHVFEIYGSTETGSFATRQPTKSPYWQPLSDAQLIESPEGWRAITPLAPAPVVLSDHVRVLRDGRFELEGRHEDMVRVAGKRQSLGTLNALLSTFRGCADAAYVAARQEGSDLLYVFVVAGQGASQGLLARVRAHMLRHVDPVFVPRRIFFVDQLPRNETGKIPKEAAQMLIANHTGDPSAPSRLRAP